MARFATKATLAASITLLYTLHAHAITDAARAKMLDCGETPIEYAHVRVDAAAGVSVEIREHAELVSQHQAENQTTQDGPALLYNHVDDDDTRPGPPDTTYDPAHFVTLSRMDGEHTIHRVLLKAPVHTCTIKYYPGLKHFLLNYPRIPRFEVGPYSQPPNLNMYNADEELVEHVNIDYEATGDEIAAFLRKRGVPVPLPLGLEETAEQA